MLFFGHNLLIMMAAAVEDNAVTFKSKVRKSIGDIKLY